MTAPIPNNVTDQTATVGVHAAYHNTLAGFIAGYPWYNTQGYGATGDGSTDDTAAVQAAITAAGAAGGVVFFPPGTYMVNKLTLSQGVSLCGVPGVSILKLRASQNTALLTTNGFVTTDSSAGLYSFELRDLIFDGNKANQSSNSDSGCVQVYGYNYRITNCIIRNGKTVNLYSNWGTSSAAPGPNGISMEAYLTNVETYGAGSDGVVWNGPHDSVWLNVISHENAAKGVSVTSRGNALKATNCHSWGNSQTYGFFVAATSCMLLNCEAEGASVAQVDFSANDNQWLGGQIFAAGGATTGINFSGSCSGLVIKTKVLNCTTAAIAFGTNDAGGNIVELVCYQTSGNLYTGTAAANTTIIGTLVGGGATKPVQFMTDLYADGYLGLKDGITAPSTVSGKALIYVDTSDGDLKVKFGDGTVKTIVVDT